MGEDAPSADLLGLGEHCALPSCRQVDFLPFKCDACQKTYCLDHRSYGAHACAAAPATKQLLVIVCPVCSQSVQLQPGEAPDAAYDRHARAGACDPRNYGRVHSKPKCPARGCKEKLTSINTYACKVCRQSVCMRHRMADDHQCPGRPANGIGTGAGGSGAAAALRQAVPAVSAAAAAAAGAAASVGAQAMGLVGRMGGLAAGAPVGGGAAAAAAGGQGNAGGGGGGFRARATAAAAAAAAADPANSVRGTADRRRQQLVEQQQQQHQAAAAAGGGGWLPQFLQPAAAPPPAAAPVAARAPAPVIDLTGDAGSEGLPTSGGGGGGGARAEFACHRCGAGFHDPVALVEHDARCARAAAAAPAAGVAGAAGAGGRGGAAGAGCRVS